MMRTEAPGHKNRSEGYGYAYLGLVPHNSQCNKFIILEDENPIFMKMHIHIQIYTVSCSTTLSFPVAAAVRRV